MPYDNNSFKMNFDNMLHSLAVENESFSKNQHLLPCIISTVASIYVSEYFRFQEMVKHNQRPKQNPFSNFQLLVQRYHVPLDAYRSKLKMQGQGASNYDFRVKPLMQTLDVVISFMRQVFCNILDNSNFKANLFHIFSSLVMFRLLLTNQKYELRNVLNQLPADNTQTHAAAYPLPRSCMATLSDNTIHNYFLNDVGKTNCPTAFLNV